MKKTEAYITVILLVLCSCSTTKHIGDGEQLYTGIDKIEFIGKKKYASSPVGETAISEIEAALSVAPNASIAGSSSLKSIPFGLWWYNAFYNSKSKIGQWFFRNFASSPVLISQVNPELRAQVATNVLDYYGYFHGKVTSEVITNKKNPKKASIRYKVTLHEPYSYDSIAYTGFTPRADSLIAATWKERLLKSGEQFSVQNLSGERERLNTLLRNNGYYYSQTGYIDFLADTINKPGKTDLRVQPVKGLATHIKRPYTIGNVNIRIINNNISSMIRNGRFTTDTLHRRNFSYIYTGEKPPVRPGAIMRNIFLRKGNYYSQEAQQLSLQRLSQMNIFSSVNFSFTPRPENDTIDMNVTAQLDKPYYFTFELNATSKSNSQIGPGSKISLSRNNLFRGGEILKLTLQGSYEWQTDGSLKGRQAVINSWEIGSDVTLTFPRLFFPLIQRKYLRFPATTTLRIYGDQMNRSGFFKMVHVGGEVKYDIYSKRTTTHTVTPFRLTYDMLQRTTAKFDSIAAENPSISHSFRNQFIPAMQYTFTYDNTATRHRNKTHLEVSATSSGNITSLVFMAFGDKWDEKDKNLFNNPYAQFLKLTAELRQLYKINSKNHIATRLMAGIIKSYGNSEYAPYSEQFYIGGANSLRGFTVRSIGPGSYHPAKETRYSYLDETGTLKLEANVEYRFGLFGNLYGALFADAGNIWLIEKDDSRPGGEFSLKNFARQIALNTGVGIRYDLEFMVLRLDFGYALHAPYNTGKSGYFNLPDFGDAFAWHFAIGYPF
ncbi:MAG: BamA/TamA family outer membrane protein [Bacteroidaceae bacterium]|nr:BamA/TamA family outer membrane protein [Bacteroidaceae bacterium]